VHPESLIAEHSAEGAKHHRVGRPTPFLLALLFDAVSLGYLSIGLKVSSAPRQGVVREGSHITVRFRGNLRSTTNAMGNINAEGYYRSALPST
jgi:hypothetical protein